MINIYTNEFRPLSIGEFQKLVKELREFTNLLILFNEINDVTGFQGLNLSKDTKFIRRRLNYLADRKYKSEIRKFCFNSPLDICLVLEGLKTGTSILEFLNEFIKNENVEYIIKKYFPKISDKVERANLKDYLNKASTRLQLFKQLGVLVRFMICK